MNKLSLEKRIKIINCLVEGMSIRGTARLLDCSINTVMSLFIQAGEVCIKFHDETVRNVNSKRVQCDEIWSFVHAKKKNAGLNELAGDLWTWVAIDSDTKLVLSWVVGTRDACCANELIEDLSSRIIGRIQLTTDGLKHYIDPVERIFANNIDFAQVEKRYNDRKQVIAINVNRIAGIPDPNYISTNSVERQNLTMRMHIKRFTRRTNAHSKHPLHHAYSVGLHFVYYNFCKIHSTIRVTPAMEAGLTNDIMEISDIVKLIDKRMAA